MRWPAPLSLSDGPRALLAVSVACACSLAALTGDVLDHGPLSRVDPPVHTWFVRHRAGALSVSLETLTWLGSSTILIPLLLAVGGYLLWSRRDLRTTLFVWVTFAGAMALAQAGKALVARSRPPVSEMLVYTTGHAFPSGHATQVITGWGLLAVLAVKSCAPRNRTGAAVIIGAVAIIAVVGLSRIYLGVHWLTDVLGGYLLGAAWLALMLAGRSRHGGLSAAPVRPVVVVDEATDATDPW